MLACRDRLLSKPLHERRQTALMLFDLLGDLQENLTVFFPGDPPQGPFDKTASPPPSPANKPVREVGKTTGALIVI